MNTHPRPAPLACSSCPHALTAAKLPTVPEDTRRRWARLLNESAPCPYLAAMGEAQS